MNKTYLGDGVYVEVEDDSQHVILTAENGTEQTDRIYLDSHVLRSFLRFISTYVIETE